MGPMVDDDSNMRGMMQHDYKGFSPGMTMDTVTEEDWKAAPALQETPVTSAICEPVNGAELEEGTEEVSGGCIYLLYQTIKNHF